MEDKNTKDDLKVKAKESSFGDFHKYVVEKLKNTEGFYEWFDEQYKSKDFSISAKIGDGFYIDLSLLRKCYNSLKNY